MATQEGEAGTSAAAPPPPGDVPDAPPEPEGGEEEEEEDEEETVGSSAFPEEDEDGMDSFVHHESIYSFMILYPELNRIKYGSYWNSKVFLSFALFFLNLLMQIALTHITGESILEDNLAFRATLINEGDFMRLPDLASTTKEIGETIQDLVDPQDSRDCCRGPHCASEASCCAPRSKADSAEKTKTSLASVGRPEPKEAPVAAAAIDAGRRLRRVAAAASRAASLTVPGSFLAKPGGGKGKKEAPESGQKQGTVCQVRGKDLDCAQPSFAFMDKWELLDADGDGNWTYDEAERDDANLGCTLVNTGLTPEAVFRSFCRGITKFYPDLATSKDRKSQRNRYRAKLLEQVPDSIQETESIPRPYFEIWKGLVTLCAATDVRRCGQLVYSGIFDAALAPKGGKGFKNLDAAMDYCQKILRDGGLCDNVLPVTYIMYRQQVREKCGTPHYLHGLDYVSPVNQHDVLHLVNVEYEKIGQFQMASGWRFRFFLGLILLVWYVNLLGELEAVILLADFVWNFPTESSDPFRTRVFWSRISEVLAAARREHSREHHSRPLSSRSARRSPHMRSPRSPRPATNASSSPAGALQSHLQSNHSPGSISSSRRPSTSSQPSARTFGRLRRPSTTSRGWSPRVETGIVKTLSVPDDTSIVIQAISRPHKATIVLMVMVRFTLIMYMAAVGTIFILTTYSYPDLLMNAVALAFVFELPEFFYTLLVGHQEKEQLERVEPLRFKSSLPQLSGTGQIIASKYFLGLFVFPALCYGFVEWNHRVNIAPVSEALQCVCFQWGPRCLTQRFMDRTWWDDHWSQVAWSFGN